MKSRSQLWYEEVVRKTFLDMYPVKSVEEIPQLTKIVCHMGVGSATVKRSDVVPPMVLLTLLTGQKALPCTSKKAVAGFHLRENTPIGCMVTLRKDRMYDFFDVWLTKVLPALRDFNGLSKKALDKAGNYSVGVDDVFAFPTLAPYGEKFPTEIVQGKRKLIGMDITFVTTAKTPEKAALFWSLFGVPMG